MDDSYGPGISATSGDNTASADLSEYRLGINDRIRIDVFGEPDLSLDAMVDPNGRIEYPLLGQLAVADRTARQVQEAIVAGLANGYLVKPDVRVAVTQYRPFFVTGEVRKAGAYPFVSGLTIEKALALAGGMTPLASTRRIYLLRENTLGARARIRVGLGAPVLPGDTVIVEQGLF